MRIDAHQHFWNYDSARMAWITEKLGALRRDFLPGDLEPLLRRYGFDGCIAVQARQSLEETRRLLELACAHSFIYAVVGWFDLRSPGVERDIDELAGGALAGARHIVQDEPDGEFLLRPEFLRGVAALGKRGLVYDVLIYEKHLPVACRFAAALPDQPLVLDHVAKPAVGRGDFRAWREGLIQMSKYANVACKVSGLATEADWAHWRVADLAPYWETALEAFGPERLMFGSDWPVCTLAAPYDGVVAAAQEFARSLTDSERSLLFGGTAARVYRIPAGGRRAIE